jgi:hypothetical protein
VYGIASSWRVPAAACLSQIEWLYAPFSRPDLLPDDRRRTADDLCTRYCVHTTGLVPITPAGQIVPLHTFLPPGVISAQNFRAAGLLLLIGAVGVRATRLRDFGQKPVAGPSLPCTPTLHASPPS